MGRKCRDLYYKWRYYNLGKDAYDECFDRAFLSNIASLRQANLLVAVLVSCFTVFPLLIEKRWDKTAVYITVAVVAIIVEIITRRIARHTDSPPSKRVLYALTVVYYINLMTFGIYLDIWTDSQQLAGLFPCLLIASMLFYVYEPAFHLILNTIAWGVFVTLSVIVKPQHIFVYDIVLSVISSFIALYFTWYITQHKLTAAHSVASLESSLEKAEAKAEKIYYDPLTGIYNRRYLDSELTKVIKFLSRAKSSLCVMMVDVDFFKKYNDTYGHGAGDACLTAIAKTLAQAATRMGDFAARYGGEEFAVVLPYTDLSGARIIADKLLMSIRYMNIPHTQSAAADRVTISIGVAVGMVDAIQTPADYFKAADLALYEAKRTGRNRYVMKTL